MGQFAEVGGAAHPDLRIESPVTASSENSRIPPEPGMSSYDVLPEIGWIAWLHLRAEQDLCLRRVAMTVPHVPVVPSVLPRSDLIATVKARAGRLFAQAAP